MEVILYSTHCPRCNIIETKLKQKQINYVEITDIDDESIERRVILVDSIGNDHIDYRYWTEDGEYKTATLFPHLFQEGTCKIYKITAEDLK